MVIWIIKVLCHIFFLSAFIFDVHNTGNNKKIIVYATIYSEIIMQRKKLRSKVIHHFKDVWLCYVFLKGTYYAHFQLYIFAQGDNVEIWSTKRDEESPDWLLNK